jgi:lysophospholipid acyltransferase (LPLAT)-like uncharacterized protein
MRRWIQRPTPFIAAIWHSRILMFSYLYAGWRAAILVSASADGEIIARILARQGHEPVRGSTSRGGRKALAELVRRIRNGQNAVIIPDGPRGPRFRVQPGIVALARKTGAPILPMTYSARRGYAFNSWDRFLLPAPFTRCRIVYGRPVYVPAELDEHGFEAARLRLETELNRITLRADRACGRDDIAPADLARFSGFFTDSP